MRNLLILFFAALFLAACNVKTIPIKGSYLKPPYVLTTSSPFENVWDKLIDLFAQKGLPIRIIDKSSGLITSDRAILQTTIETKEGKLKDPAAFIVIPQIYDPGSRKYSPISKYADVSGEWNVRVKQSDGQTTINVNIVNVRYQSWDAYHKVNRDLILSEYQSTGVFEKLIAEKIK
ncbi:MAG: hypothetical protein JST17_14040 [Bacteroidetes bacterium]|nr:hypothetical protein [Bacteroidota bacterium]MBS1931072.1 hypothetical protein [Bacteroidota bacterium]